MMIDVEKYMHYLDGYDMTHKQKVDWLYALQEFAQIFVDVAWDFDPNNPTHVYIQKYAEEFKDKPLPPEIEKVLRELEENSAE